MAASDYVGTTWTRLTGTVTPIWSRTLGAVRFYVAATSTYRVDDVALVHPSSLPLLAPVPGT